MIFIFLAAYMRCKRVIAEDTMMLMFLFGFFELIAIEFPVGLLLTGVMK